MNSFNFQAASAVSLVYLLVKCVLLAVLVFSSSLWRQSGWLLVVLLATGLVLTAFGMLFKVEHWAFGTELMLAGAILIASSYARRYNSKSQRYLLDHLKLSWVLAACLAVVAAAIHFLVKPAAGLAEALFWAMALLFVYQRWIQRSAPV